MNAESSFFFTNPGTDAVIAFFNHPLFIYKYLHNNYLNNNTMAASAYVYLNFMGNTEEAFEFYRSVIGGEFSGLMRFEGTPYGDELPEADRHKIMHIGLPMGAGTMIMGTDALESMGQTLTFGNNNYICLGPESLEEAEHLFNGLSAGGKIEQQLEKMFWGDYFGSFTDKFGVSWMVNYNDQQ